MKTFKTLEQIKRFESQQVTIQDLLNGRMYLRNKGWSDVRLTDELKERICLETAGLLGGVYKTKKRVFNTLLNDKPQHWGLDRIFIRQYKKEPAVLTYCAGQDYPTELNQIRTALK